MHNVRQTLRHHSRKTRAAARRALLAGWFSAAAAAVGACADDDAERARAGESGDRAAADLPDSDPQGAPAYKVSSRNLVQWKRAAAIEADLMRALDLDASQLCNELGDKSCIRAVHLVPLGGNEPYVSGLMKPSVEPLATSSSVIDRVLLSACSQRAQLDSEGDAKVFGALDFDKPLPAPDAPAIRDTVVALYRRLLARDPLSSEVRLVASLAETPEDAQSLSVRDFAALACFSIGSSTEFLFF